MAYITDTQSRTFFSFGTLAAALKSLNYKLKYGRMVSVLSSMSDAQLAQSGIKRKDIMAHAETLISK